MIPPTPPNPGGPGHWNLPDYNALITQWMQPYQAMYDANNSAWTADTNAMSQVAHDRFRVGPYSTLAQLRNQHEIGQRNVVNDMTARGLTHSSEQPYQVGQEDLRFKTQKKTAANALLDYLQGLQQNLAERQRQALGGLLDQRTNTAQTIGGLYSPTWTPQGNNDAGYAGGSPGWLPYIPNVDYGGGSTL